MGFDEKVVVWFRGQVLQSGLAITHFIKQDRCHPIKKLAGQIAECAYLPYTMLGSGATGRQGLRNPEYQTFENIFF
jgi:hypothetical protein